MQGLPQRWRVQGALQPALAELGPSTPCSRGLGVMLHLGGSEWGQGRRKNPGSLLARLEPG